MRRPARDAIIAHYYRTLGPVEAPLRHVLHELWMRFSECHFEMAPIAQKMSVPEETIWQWLSGDIDIDLKQFLKLVYGLGLDFEIDLVRRQPAPNKEPTNDASQACEATHHS